MSKATIGSLRKHFLDEVMSLPDDKLEVALEFVEFIKVREDPLFIDYVNMRTAEAVKDRKTGKKFYALKELQNEYAGL